MKKKLWIAGLSSMLALAGCSGSSEEGGSAGSGGTAADPTTISLYTHGNEASYNWSETIAAFEKEHPEINVDLVVLSEKGDTNEATQKLDLAAASGEKMDVLMFSDPTSYAQRVSLGMVAPMDEYIKEEGYNVTEEYKVDTAINGEHYALPGKFNPWYVLLNKDHLDAAGLEVPKEWTWDEFVEYSKKMTTKDHFGTYFHGPQNGGWMEYMKLALASEETNTDFVTEDGKSNLDNPLFRKTLEIRQQMEKEDKSATPYTDIMSQKLHYRTQFFNQDASSILIGSWMNTELGGTDQFPLNFNVAVAPYPKNDAAAEGGFTPVTTDFVSIGASSENPKEAYEFIRWYTTEGQIAQGKNIPSWNGVSDEELAQTVDTILAGTVSPDKVDKESLLNVLKNAKSSKMVAPVSYNAEISKVVNEEYEKMIFGEQDLDQTVEAADKRVQELIDNNK